MSRNDEMFLYLAELDGGPITASSKRRTYTHEIVTVFAADVDEARERLSRLVVPDTVHVWEAVPTWMPQGHDLRYTLEDDEDWA